MTATYAPILNLKLGELKAAKNLFQPDRTSSIPMFVMADDLLDLEDETVAKPVGGPYQRVVGQLQKYWGSTPFYIDARALDSQSPPSPHPVQDLFDACRQAGLQAIPVAGLGSSALYDRALASIVATDARGCAVRLDPEDLISTNLASALGGLPASLGLLPAAIDLFLDWGYILPDAGASTVLAVAAVVPRLPHLMSWRSVVFAASSFPQMLTGFGVGLSTITRAEWAAYKVLLDQPPGGRVLAFGDYAIAHPVQTSAPFLGSASIRYTTVDDWLIVRGHTLKGPVYGGFAQYQQLAAQLVARQEYCGSSFSWGDKYIADCAAGTVGTGNLTTWRGVGTNHHLTFVTRQLASHRAPSNGIAPPPVGP